MHVGIFEAVYLDAGENIPCNIIIGDIVVRGKRIRSFFDDERGVRGDHYDHDE